MVVLLTYDCRVVMVFWFISPCVIRKYIVEYINIMFVATVSKDFEAEVDLGACQKTSKEYIIMNQNLDLFV